MKNDEKGVCGSVGVILFCLAMLMGNSDVLAADGAQFVSQKITNGTQIMPRTVFTQTWTMSNTGTTTWTPGDNYTFNITNSITNTPDCMGGVPLAPKTATSYHLTAMIDSGQSVPANGTATFSVTFIAPEAAGTYSDTFQMNNSSGVFFGQQVTFTINVQSAGSTSQYDRARAVSYANNYDGYVCSDGYYWTNSSDYGTFGNHATLPPVTGDDCAHFVSCCIGSEPHLKGGGLAIPSRTGTYGEPGAQALIYKVLIGGNYATEVSSLDDMSPGDVIGWNWEGDTSTNSIDHVTLYLGNGVLASHANSCLDASATSWYPSGSVHHYIHIYDAPTLGVSRTGNKMVLSWGTNWTSYSLYSASSLVRGATWTKVTASPTKVGMWNTLTNTMSTNAVFFRMMMP